ncbi:hypothetical protein [Parapedobacter soli]|uniref:hypothetical protein n=1 Tax=Parapedobacter soli TaxID=416955 RepID=UPI0021C62286|nr:hypothetical protein [Parapedobacter soli]
MDIRRDAKDNESQSRPGRGKTKGGLSPQGHRAQVCAHFGWTMQYMLWGISWMQLHKMLVDQPVYEYDEDNGGAAPKTDYERFMAFNANL